MSALEFWQYDHEANFGASILVTGVDVTHETRNSGFPINGTRLVQDGERSRGRVYSHAFFPELFDELFSRRKRSIREIVPCVLVKCLDQSFSVF